MTAAATERLALHALDKESLVTMIVELRAAVRPRLAPQAAAEAREYAELATDDGDAADQISTSLLALLDWHDNAGRVLASHLALKPRNK